MKQKTTFTALILLSLFVGSLLGQEGDTETPSESKSRKFSDGTRYLGIRNIAYNDLKGGQLGLAYNRVMGNFSGVQIAGLANVVEGSALGLQLALLANVVEEDASVAQIAGFASVTGEDAGLQFSGLASVAGEDAVFQFGGLAAIAGGNAAVGQASFLVSVAAEAAPVQVSGLVSVSAEKRSLAQISGMVSVSREGAVLQVGGLVTVSGESAGAQVGMVNIAPQAFLQMGLVNVAQESFLPLGVVNVIDGFPLRYSFVVDGYGQATLAIRSGNRHFYTAVGLQGGDDVTFKRLNNLLAGIGLLLPVQRAYVSAEYLVNQRFGTYNDLNSTLGVRLGYRLTPFLGVTAGAALPWNDLADFGALSSGWSVGLEWYHRTTFNIRGDWN